MQREEIFKTGCVPNLVSMLERGDTDDKLAAVGAISVLARSEKHITEVISSKVRCLAGQGRCLVQHAVLVLLVQHIPSTNCWFACLSALHAR